MYLHSFYLEQLTNKSAVREDIGALDPSSVKKELPGNCFLNARIHTAYRDPSEAFFSQDCNYFSELAYSANFFNYHVLLMMNFLLDQVSCASQEAFVSYSASNSAPKTSHFCVYSCNDVILNAYLIKPVRRLMYFLVTGRWTVSSIYFQLYFRALLFTPTQ